MAAYPRKQTVAIFILCAFAVGGVAYYVWGQEKAKPVALEERETAALIAATQDLTNNVDWQKQFLSGAASSTAFRAEARPTKKSETEIVTATDRLSRSFFSKYIELRQQGKSKDSAAVSDAINEALAEGMGSMTLPREYTAKDVGATTDSPASVAAYSSVVSVLVETHSSSDDGARFALQAFEAGDASKLALIDPVIRDYQVALSKLIATPVPQSLVEQHVALLNGFSMALYSAQSFRTIDTNPLQGLIGIRLSAASTESIAAAWNSIENHL